MNQIKFSIIVPCYNVEDYIDECVESFLKQTFENFEVLLINDGSTDETYIKCQHWSNLDKRIKLYNKKNEGLSATRNKGIEYSNGQYLIFVDSDDFIMPDSLQTFSNILTENTEVLITRLIEVFPDEVKYRDGNIEKKISQNPSKNEAIKWTMNKSFNTWPAQKYIVSKEFLTKNNLLFKEGFLHEDIDWTARLFSLANNFSVSYYPWYFHRKERPGSITSVVKPKRITDIMCLAHALITNKNSLIYMVSQKESKIIINRIMTTVYSSLSDYKNLQEFDKHIIVDAMLKYKSIFRYRGKLKYQLFVFSMNLIGYQKTLNILTLFK